MGTRRRARGVAALAAAFHRIRTHLLGRESALEREVRLRTALEMDALYQLTGSVAHDLNNALGVILGYAAMVRRNLPAEEGVQRRVAEILSAADRATALTRELMALSHKTGEGRVQEAMRP
jgi:signal transduction histidine kinase